MKPTCFNHQNFDPCRRSTPPPTPMLVSLYLARTTLLRVMMTSDINLKVSHTMLRSSSWPAHLHGDNLQKNTYLLHAIRRCVLLLPRLLPCSHHCRLHGTFFWLKGPNGTFFGSKTFHCMAVGIQYLYADVSKNAKASTHGGCV